MQKSRSAGQTQIDRSDMTSRRIKDLLPELQEKYALFRKKMTEAGLDFIVTATYRSQKEQDRLFAQGRTAPGRIVTWTRRSKHTARKAFDIAMRVNGKISWEPKDYLKAGEIGKSIGLIWGGDWKRRDMPHFQLKK